MPLNLRSDVAQQGLTYLPYSASPDVPIVFPNGKWLVGFQTLAPDGTTIPGSIFYPPQDLDKVPSQIIAPFLTSYLQPIPPPQSVQPPVNNPPQPIAPPGNPFPPGVPNPILTTQQQPVINDPNFRINPPINYVDASKVLGPAPPINASPQAGPRPVPVQPQPPAPVNFGFNPLFPGLIPIPGLGPIIVSPGLPQDVAKVAVPIAKEIIKDISDFGKIPVADILIWAGLIMMIGPSAVELIKTLISLGVMKSA